MEAMLAPQDYFVTVEYALTVQVGAKLALIMSLALIALLVIIYPARFAMLYQQIVPLEVLLAALSAIQDTS